MQNESVGAPYSSIGLSHEGRYALLKLKSSLVKLVTQLSRSRELCQELEGIGLLLEALGHEL